MDLNQAIINYIVTCPKLANSPLFFNSINAKDKSKQLVTIAGNTNTNKKYIDGSVEKTYTFTIIDYRSIIDQPVVKVAGYPSENVLDMNDVQGLIDWVETQNTLRNFPNFGESNDVISITATSNTPNLNGIDTQIQPALAKYSVSIQVTYIDNSKRIWS